MPYVKVNVELRVCEKDRPPSWGFVADGLFFPLGPTAQDKEIATKSAQLYEFGDRRWAGIPLSRCGPNLDLTN